jgi:hypothetical protein
VGKVTVLKVGRDEDIDVDEEAMDFILLQSFALFVSPVDEGFSRLVNLTDIFGEIEQGEKSLSRDLPHKVRRIP